MTEERCVATSSRAFTAALSQCYAESSVFEAELASALSAGYSDALHVTPATLAALADLQHPSSANQSPAADTELGEAPNVPEDTRALKQGSQAWHQARKVRVCRASESVATT